MKLATIIIIISCLHLSAAVYSQNIRVSGTDVTLKTVFSKLKKQSGYTFFYRSELVNPLKVSVDIKNATIDQAMEQCLQNTGLTYFIIESTVIVVPKVQPIPVTVALNRPATTYITGRVTDEHGLPLVGVTIAFKETNRRYATNNAGLYNAIVFDKDKTVTFSFIGYKTQEITLKDQKVLNVIMVEDISHLDQVQVVAYGTSTKRFNVGDQTTVSAKDIAKYPAINVLEALQASVPGMNIYKTTGTPGGAFSVTIRGKNGLNTGSAPMYVIDGVPYKGGGYNLQNNALGSRTGLGIGGGDALNFINPQDIESIDVLKDADATAIYGSRAANGVILITTKKGKAGDIRVEANVYSGVSKVTRLPHFLNTQQYLQMRREAKKNDKTAITANDYDINGTWDTTRYTDWAKELIGGSGHTTNAQATISGGNTNTQFRISGNYNRQSNITALTGSNQNASLSFNINSATANNKFTVSFSGGYFYNNNTITNVDLTGSLGLPPDAPALFKPDGSLNFENNTFNNPLVIRNSINSTPANNLTSSAALSYKIIKGLDLRANVGFNRQEINEFLGSPSTAFAPVYNATSGNSNFTTNINTNWSIEPQLNYTTKLGKSQLNATVGSSLQYQTLYTSELTVDGYTSDLLLRNPSAGTKINSIAYANQKLKNNSLFGRVNYNWDNKYVLNVSGRYDGSSKFGENKRFHLFGAVGAGWIFTEEKFIKDNLPFISFGKLRASYGITGNDQIPANGYLETYRSTTYAYQGVPGLYPAILPNPDLSWESTKKAEIGLELQFFQSRIALEANYYRNRTSDILVGYPLSLVTGFSSISQNLPAVIQNKGWEFTVRTANVKNTNFSWSSVVLFTVPRNTLLSYPGVDASSFANSYILGKPTNILRVYKFAGVNPQTGIYQFYDKDGKITNNPVPEVDNTTLIDINPKYYGSLQNNFTYKGFTLDFTFRFIKQMGVSAFGQQFGIPPGLLPVNILTEQLGRWQKPGDIADIQRFGTSFSLITPISYAQQSTKGYADASYIRFQNLSLGYQFPQSIVKHLHVQSLRIYFQGENLLTISKYGNLDPENQSAYSLPLLKTFTTGLQVTL